MSALKLHRTESGSPHKPAIIQDIPTAIKAQLTQYFGILIYLLLSYFNPCVFVPHDGGDDTTWRPACECIEYCTPAGAVT